MERFSGGTLVERGGTWWNCGGTLDHAPDHPGTPRSLSELKTFSCCGGKNTKTTGIPAAKPRPEPRSTKRRKMSPTPRRQTRSSRRRANPTASSKAGTHASTHSHWMDWVWEMESTVIQRASQRLTPHVKGEIPKSITEVGDKPLDPTTLHWMDWMDMRVILK